MSSYDDPRWYEQPKADELYRSTPDEQFNLSSAANSNTANHQNASTEDPPPNKGRGLGQIFGQIVVTVALMIIAFLGGWFGHQAFSTLYFNPSNQSKSYANLIQQAWNIVDKNYVDRKAINYKEMSYQAISAMLNVLHDTGHTRFLTPQDVQAQHQELSGSLVGIGARVGQDTNTGQIIVTSTVPGSPSEKAGIKSGDIIVAVDGESVVGKDQNTIVGLIDAGSAGTSVSVTVKRPSINQVLTFKMKREVIKIPSVILHYITEDHIAHIQIAQFSDGASAQLRTALNQAKKLGAKEIILDLRDDPGGYLQEAINVASEFIGKGNVLLEQDSTGQRTPDPVDGHPIDTTTKIVVLVNHYTGSAAEIVSGALQDNHRAIIVGTKTFGTGTVLDEFDLSDGSAILLGTSEWLTPDGHFIRDQGISPNVQVQLSSNANPLTPDAENQDHMTLQQILGSGDTQLLTAITYLQSH